MIKPPYLAIDYGKKHIGIAISDKLGLVAQPLDVIHVTKNITWEDILLKLKNIVDEYSIMSIIIGSPQKFETNEDKNQTRIEFFAKEVYKSLLIPYIIYDESYSTKDAQNIIISQGSSLKKKKRKIDSIAASVFLQEYLDNISKE